MVVVSGPKPPPRNEEESWRGGIHLVCRRCGNGYLHVIVCPDCLRNLRLRAKEREDKKYRRAAETEALAKTVKDMKRERKMQGFIGDEKRERDDKHQ